jgi:predicted nuclease of predicted toxin-antitoxin system
MMKFKVDENLPMEVAKQLVTAGHDALTVSDQQLSGHVDSEVIDVCRNEGRALVTLDLGFADIRAYPPAAYPGIVVLRLARLISTASCQPFSVCRLRWARKFSPASFGSSTK